jgi:hypothetical protein
MVTISKYQHRSYELRPLTCVEILYIILNTRIVSKHCYWKIYNKINKLYILYTFYNLIFTNDDKIKPQVSTFYYVKNTVTSIN